MRKKVRKSISVLLLALAIAVTQIPPANAGAAKKTDFVIEGTTLISYEGTDFSVSIPRSIEKISQDAFADNMVVKEITIPDTVEVIEAGAFAGCGNLTEINIPASVEEIGSGAFADCGKLTTISVNENNEFFKCSDGVLYNKKGTKLYQVLAGTKQSVYFIPNSIEKIEKYAFWGCENINQIVFGKGLTEVPEYAFSNCKGLRTITVPSMITAIQLKAFEDCINLEEIYISPSVTYIHETAFDGCRNVKFQYEDATMAAKFAESFKATNVAITDYEESESTETVRPSQAGDETVSNNQVEYPLSDVSNLDVSKLPNGLETPESSEVMGKTKIVSSQAVVFLDNSKMQVQSGESSESSKENPILTTEEESTESEPDTFYDGEEIIEKYIITNGNTIADRAFYKDSTRTSYEIPDGIKKIGDFSFAYTGLTSIEVPYGVESIGYGAFYKSMALSTVSIPETVKTIEPSAFEDTAWIEKWKNGPDVNEFFVVGDGILISYKGNDSKVVIPENVKKIGANVFEGHSEISSVYIPDNVKEIGEDAFKDCTGLMNVSGGNYVKKICDRAFLNCPLESIRIPSSVEEIGLRAFDQENDGKSDCVVFLGNKLPTISYEKTAARYTNSEFRKNALNSVEVAVVNNTVNDFEDTILDDENMGFRGIVCSISKEPTGTDRGRVKVKYVSNDESGYPVNVPDAVWIYGMEYDVESINTDAYHGFSLEQTEQADQAEEPDQAEQADQVEETYQAEQTEGLQEQLATAESNIGLEVTHPDYKENPLTTVMFSENTTDYIVTLSKNEDNEEILSTLLNSRYGPVTNSNYKAFDLSMKTVKGNISIKSLGKERLTVTIPVSSDWIDTPIVAVCLDNNGQLEFTSCKQYKTDAGSYVTFVAKHFSPYGLYQGDNVPQSFKEAFDEKIAMRKGAEYNVDYGRKDVSPDTGDYIEPKWLLAIGLLALSVFLFFAKDRKNIIIK